MAFYCPNCAKEILENAPECAYCNADFTAASGWRPTLSRPPMESEDVGASSQGSIGRFLGRLFVGVIIWFVIFVFSFILGYFLPAGQGALLFWLVGVTGVAILYWAFKALPSSANEK